MQIPSSDILSTNRLGNAFNNTTATYKFFWLISILQIHATSNARRIRVWDIVIRMVANAWYPIHYFRLSFGKNDSLFSIAKQLQELTPLTMDSDTETIIETLKDRINEPAIKSLLTRLTINVPYRFLSPWIDTPDNKEMVLRSQTLENGCLYSIHRDGEFYIELNSAWGQYLHYHYQILMDFSLWNLTLFLQTRNPNVPGILNKLSRPDTRVPLTRQHEYWDMVMEIGGPLHCIYTDTLLHPGDYDLDHFMPWSFVTHNQLWNLIPSEGSINSSKSNQLPDLDSYLPKLASIHHNSLKLLLLHGKTPQVMEDYISLGYTPQDLAMMSDDKFRAIYDKTFKPISQIAQNMGYGVWKY